MRKTVYPNPDIAKRIDDTLGYRENTEIAKTLGMERKSISNYRRAITAPHLNFILWLCKEYHLDANWLLNLEN